jgi:hypothetical protein
MHLEVAGLCCLIHCDVFGRGLYCLFHCDVFTTRLYHFLHGEVFTSNWLGNHIGLPLLWRPVENWRKFNWTCRHINHNWFFTNLWKHHWW